MIWLISRRMNALSSTTRTLDAELEDTIALLEGAHLDSPVSEMKIDAAPVVEPRVFCEKGNPGGRQHFARGGNVALTR